MGNSPTKQSYYNLASVLYIVQQSIDELMNERMNRCIK